MKKLELNKTEFFSPSRQFEERLGITGIAADYIFPDGMSREEAEALYLKDCLIVEGYENPVTATLTQHFDDELGRLNKHLDALIDLNPSLSVVRYDKGNPIQIGDILRGAASLFPPEGLDYKTSKFPEEIALDHLDEDGPWRQLEHRLHRITGEISICWSPSPATIEKINKALDEKYGVEAPEQKQSKAPPRTLHMRTPENKEERIVIVAGFDKSLES